MLLSVAVLNPLLVLKGSGGFPRAKRADSARRSVHRANKPTTDFLTVAGTRDAATTAKDCHRRVAGDV
jgi:hypothetical protein